MSKTNRWADEGGLTGQSGRGAEEGGREGGLTGWGGRGQRKEG